MAEFENDEIETQDVYDEVDNETSNDDSPTYEDYIAIKERLAKAEKSLVDYKKKAKNSTNNT
jgi:hypothetical protein